LHAVPTLLHDWSEAIGHSTGVIGPLLEWLTYALASSVVGVVIGGIIVVIVRRFTKHPEELVVDL
jgi:uncharacterized protein